MISRLLGRLSYGNVIATVALFLALGGGAFAVTAPKNSVKTKSIKNRAVTSRKIDSLAVKLANIDNGAVAAKKLRGNAVTAQKLATGSVNTGKIRDAAVTDAKLQDGAVTDAKLSADALTNSIQVTKVDGPSVTVPNGQSLAATTTCPAGTQALSGEAALLSPSNSIANAGVISSRRDANDPRKWLVRVGNNTGATHEWQLGAICVSGLG